LVNHSLNINQWKIDYFKKNLDYDKFFYLYFV